MSTVNAPQPRPSFYTAGGTLDPMASSYIVRRADKDLLEAVTAGQYCYILTSRQTGKSSLMMRTANSLGKIGIKSVIIDLSALSTSNTTTEQWYLEQALAIVDQLNLDENYIISWWEKQSKLSAIRRFTTFLTQTVLKQIDQPLVIFLDEIDSTLSLPFNCDDYFAVIRSLYNRRAADPVLKGLTFVLFGVASPSDLIKDARRTPFNIGMRIQLSDFTKEEAQPLKSGLAPDEQSAEKMLEDILFFTGGHPYLTQKTCLHVAEWAETQWNEVDAPFIVERLVGRLFLSETGQNTDDNLQFIRTRILSSKAKKRLLRTYRAVQQGHLLPDNELDPIHMELKLSGLIKVNGQATIVSNTIYRKVFDETWIRENMPSSLWPRLIFILPALGGPPAAILFAPQVITGHPLLAITIGLLYEISILILSFVGQIWQQLERPWASRTYRQRYFQFLLYQHRDFDVRGLATLGAYTLELDSLFVELRVDPTTPMQVSSNPISLPREPSGRNQSLMDYLKSDALKSQHIVIIGPPGSGKTTLLKHITLTLVSRKKRRYYLKNMSHTFPVLLFLRDHVRSIVEDQSDFSLVHALRDHLRKWEQFETPIGWIERQLTHGRCLIMLDGLDEAANPEARRKVVDWVQTQMIAFNKNRFIVTSRPFGYRNNPLSSVIILEVLPFSYEQIAQFIEKWYLANEMVIFRRDDPGVHIRAREGAQDLLRRLHQAPSLLELAVNPLLLTMIATVHRYRSSLPGKRVELYAEIFEVFLGKRQEARGVAQELTAAQKQQVLQPFAYYLMIKGKRNVTVPETQDAIKEPLARVAPRMLSEDFLRLVENASGLLLQQENGVYSFANLTFQEYLTAVHIRNEKLEDTLIAHLEESWWQETIRLYCGISDATSIITACLRDDPPSVHALTLALDCLEEALMIQPAVSARLETVLNQIVEDANPERRRVVAEALLIRRQRQMVYMKEGVYRDTSLITCAEYQIFLDEQRAQGRYYQSDHWRGVSFPAGKGQTPILGIRRSDALAFCNWLTVRDRAGWHYRLPRAEEWPLEERQKELLADTGYWVEDEPSFVWSHGKPSDSLREQLSGCIARAIELAHTHNFDLVRAIELARINNGAIDLDYALDLAHDLDLDLARTNNPTLDLVYTSNLSRISARDLDFTRASNRALALARDLVGISNRTLARASDLYISLFLLQERIAGRLPAYEGILLFKERG